MIVPFDCNEAWIVQRTTTLLLSWTSVALIKKHRFNWRILVVCHTWEIYIHIDGTSIHFIHKTCPSGVCNSQNTHDRRVQMSHLFLLFCFVVVVVAVNWSTLSLKVDNNFLFWFLMYAQFNSWLMVDTLILFYFNFTFTWYTSTLIFCLRVKIIQRRIRPSCFRMKNTHSFLSYTLKLHNFFVVFIHRNYYISFEGHQHLRFVCFTH